MKTLNALLLASGILFAGAAPVLAADDCFEVTLGRTSSPMDIQSREARRLVKAWASATIPAALNFSFTESDVKKPCSFTDEAWRKFRTKFNVDEYVKEAQRKQTVNSAVMAKPPLVGLHGKRSDGTQAVVLEAILVSWAEGPDFVLKGEPIKAQFVLSVTRDALGETSLHVADVL